MSVCLNQLGFKELTSEFGFVTFSQMLFFRMRLPSHCLKLGFPRKLITQVASPDGVKRFLSSSQMAIAYLNSSSTSSDDEDRRSYWSTTTRTSINNFEIHPCSSTFDNLDTMAVVEILNSLGRAPKSAFSFFHRVKEAGFEHNVQTYVVLIKILCYWGLERKLDSLFHDLIAYSKRHSHPNASFQISDLLSTFPKELDICPLLIRAYDALVKSYVSVGMFDEALNIFFITKRSGISLHVNTSNFFMNHLIVHGKVDMAISVYMQLRRIGFSPNDYTYAILIKAFCRKGCLGKAYDVLMEMEEAGVTPTCFAYTTYIEGLCANHRSEFGYEVLKRCKKENVTINDEYAYVVIIRGFCEEMKLDEAKKVFLDMERQGVIPDSHTYSAMIKGYCKWYSWQQALDLHRDMISKGIKTNCVIISTILQCLCKKDMTHEVIKQFEEFKGLGIFLDEVCYNIVADALCSVGKVKEALDYLMEMETKGMKLDVVHYTTLIKGCCLQGELNWAQSLMKMLKDNGLEPDIVTYNALAAGFCNGGLAFEAYGLLDDMIAQGMKPESTHNIIIKKLCCAGKVKEAKMFLDHLEVKSKDNYSAMVEGYCEAKLAKEAYELFVWLSKQGIVVREKTFQRLLCSLFEECDKSKTQIGKEYGTWDRALNLIQTMLDLNIKPSNFIYNKLINSLCEAGNVKVAQGFLDFLVEKGLKPDVINYTVMIKNYCRANCLQDAHALFLEMKRNDIEPDIITCTILLDHHLKTRENKKQMENSPLWAVMQELKIKPDVVWYTVLINKHCKEDNLESAVALVGKMIEEGLEPDIVTNTALLLGYCKRREVNNALTLASSLADEISCKGIAPDSHLRKALERTILLERKV